jgi:hypothetical protein
MKIEQLIVQYLYNNKKVTLQEIGVFSVSEDITIPTDIEKDTVLPENSIQFKYDPKAGIDEGLINFVIDNTRKIRPLATSDLESFIMLNKQFLNIGKPLVMEGIGTLQKSNDGTLTFVQSNTSHVVVKDAPKVVTEKLKEKISFATPDKEKSIGKGKWMLMAFLALLILGGGGAAYYLVKNYKPNAEEPIAKKETSDKNTGTDETKKDTSAKALPKATVNSTDSNTFYIVINEFQNVAIAQKRIEKLQSYGHKPVLFTADSITYKVKMPFRKPLADTLRVRDSLAVFFQTKASVSLP